MGVCCRTRSRENTIANIIRKINSQNLNFEKAKLIFDTNPMKSLGNEIYQLSQSELKERIQSLAMIYKTQFNEVIYENFIIEDDCSEFELKFLMQYFERLIQAARFRKIKIVFFMFPILKAEKNTLENFWLILFQVNNNQTIKYYAFKQLLIEFFKFNIQAPLYSLISATQDRDVIEQCNKLIDGVGNESNIKKFIEEFLLKEFEFNLYSNSQSQFKYEMIFSDLLKIFKTKIPLIADLNYLRMFYFEYMQ